MPPNRSFCRGVHYVPYAVCTQVHYVPVDSPDDVEAKIQWCREHQAEVKDIIGNSTAFMWQFVVREHGESAIFGAPRRATSALLARRAWLLATLHTPEEPRAPRGALGS